VLGTDDLLTERGKRELREIERLNAEGNTYDLGEKQQAADDVAQCHEDAWDQPEGIADWSKRRRIW